MWHPIKIWVPFKSLLRVQIKRANKLSYMTLSLESNLNSRKPSTELAFVLPDRLAAALKIKTRSRSLRDGLHMILLIPVIAKEQTILKLLRGYCESSVVHQVFEGNMTETTCLNCDCISLHKCCFRLKPG